ncbi:hypothetical protein B566_EDAN007095 [Ephemera danica]|nr:hypothetical protein B566_EDAN007095 [Ephemera danica]
MARFDRMSTDPGLFVRELEQTVRIDFGTARSINTRVITARSVPEVVDLMRPFLYFVVDRETQTALLAGKVEDPSTPRIF